MTKKEIDQMLRPRHGVGGDAGRNSALVKKFHPDQRRPTYSAARANEAKDVLRRHHRRLQTPLHLKQCVAARMVLARAVTFSTIIEAFD
jgi:hypothetical protein